MKALFSFFIIVLLISCESNEKSNDPNFEWLIGSWKRTNDKPNNLTTENWKLVDHKELHGIGLTLQNTDTVFRENLKLYEENGNWIFEVTGVNEQPIPFKATSITDSSFVVENPENEFPKMIKYTMNGKQLNAVISGGGMEVSFDFQKIDE